MAGRWGLAPGLGRAVAALLGVRCAWLPAGPSKPPSPPHLTFQPTLPPSPGCTMRCRPSFVRRPRRSCWSSWSPWRCAWAAVGRAVGQPCTAPQQASLAVQCSRPCCLRPPSCSVPHHTLVAHLTPTHPPSSPRHPLPPELAVRGGRGGDQERVRGQAGRGQGAGRPRGGARRKRSRAACRRRRAAPHVPGAGAAMEQAVWSRWQCRYGGP